MEPQLRRCPNKMSIFAARHGFEFSPFPSRIPVAERSTGQPLSALGWVGVQPSAAGPEVIEQHPVNAGDVAIRAQQSLYLKRNPAAAHPVIIVPMQNNLAATQFD